MLPRIYILGRPFSTAWLAGPGFCVAAVTFVAYLKGFGEKPWFVRATELAIIAVALTGALLS
jgi:hypothetical protein